MKLKQRLGNYQAMAVPINLCEKPLFLYYSWFRVGTREAGMVPMALIRIPIALSPTGISETRKVKAPNLTHC